MTTDEQDTAADREDRQQVLQRIIDTMTREHHEGDADAATRELERRIADHGLPEMPAPWIEAVARGVVRGEAYVVSARTVEDVDVPSPRTSRPPYGVS